MSALQIFSVALIAIGCKIISLGSEKDDGLTLTDVGVNILSLVTGYFVVSTRGFSCPQSQMIPEGSITPDCHYPTMRNIYR